ncbi:hypothetical protein [Pedobacter endophyticus]|uniref:Hpt domain-containing protein n=1 Tax=Pedobacter endophyticus TaxID=2789740 RepID=A0A7S9L2J5_9SPHI|nr:hypothetical protein [Pedobacter endophyticus]QPH40976.1 hypothetical protein IZT61_06865 [Pedobacter endophyticus]
MEPNSNQNLPNARPPLYQVINLSYLHEISMGDVEFEREIAERFLHLIDDDLSALAKHAEHKDLDALKKHAHHTLSTVAVMGLNPWLEKHLKAMEHQSLSATEINSCLRIISDICEKAKADARLFLGS